jgi:segregation and condensation protein A
LSGIILRMFEDTRDQHKTLYRVVTPVYEGPLDLLLQLIERAELDITKLALAEVTDQFLEHLQQIQERTAEEVSAFIVIASRLVQIKSEVLLPRPPIREPGEEDPGEALAQQLIAYKRYREIASLLEEREIAGLRTYLSLAPPPKIEGILDLSDITLEDLREAAATIITRTDTQSFMNNVVIIPRITIRQKIRRITSLLKTQKNTTFNAILEDKHSRLEMVVTFLAMLELIKRRIINAYQDMLFGDISLEASDQINDDQEFDLEFYE